MRAFLRTVCLILFLSPRVVAAATFQVTTTTDSGAGSLRKAILDANGLPGADKIEFAIGTGPQTITPSSALPAITESVTIDASTQPGFAGTPLIEISGSGAGQGVTGLQINSGPTTIRRLVINRFQAALFGGGGNGILLQGSGGSTVEGCYLGTDRTGSAALPNAGAGIVISGSSNNLIGSFSDATLFNLVSGNGQGIRLEGASNGNRIYGNRIGTSVAGTADVGNSGDGVLVSGGSGTILGTAGFPNVISGNGGNGVTVSGTASGTWVRSNRIGTDISGSAALGNSFNGAEISVASGNTLGDASAAAPSNVISGNGAHGVRIGGGASANAVTANYIGTDITGTLPLGNAFNGVIVDGASFNGVGGADPEGRNILSGNGTRGVRLTNGASNNTVEGNWIGLSVSGAPLPNLFAGVGIDAGSSDNLIGAGVPVNPRHGNFISGNAGHGVLLSGAGTLRNTLRGNTIGLAPVTAAAAGNAGDGVHVETGASDNLLDGNVISANSGAGLFVDAGASNRLRSDAFTSIFSNGGLGIDLAPAGVTANDPGDGDLGPNGLQNFPILTSARSPGMTTIVSGGFASAPNTAYTLDFYSSTACDLSGHGEGQSYLGRLNVTTDGAGNASFSPTLPVPSPLGGAVTATATDPAGNMSEFSNCVLVPAQFFTLAPCRVADTRDPDGPYGGPALAASTDRPFVFWNRCGVPATARAVSVNLTVTQPSAQGHLTLYRGGSPPPPTSTINYGPGQTRANNAIVTLSNWGDLSARCVQASGTVHAILDVNGYFE